MSISLLSHVCFKIVINSIKSPVIIVFLKSDSIIVEFQRDDAIKVTVNFDPNGWASVSREGHLIEQFFVFGDFTNPAIIANILDSDV